MFYTRIVGKHGDQARLDHLKVNSEFQGRNQLSTNDTQTKDFLGLNMNQLFSISKSAMNLFM
jgi:hypothetical protein